MIRYSEQYIDQTDISEVVKTLKSDFITTGPQVSIFEKKLSKKLIQNTLLFLIAQLAHYTRLVLL